MSQWPAHKAAKLQVAALGWLQLADPTVCIWWLGWCCASNMYVKRRFKDFQISRSTSTIWKYRLGWIKNTTVWIKSLFQLFLDIYQSFISTPAGSGLTPWKTRKKWRFGWFNWVIFQVPAVDFPGCSHDLPPRPKKKQRRPVFGTPKPRFSAHFCGSAKVLVCERYGVSGKWGGTKTGDVDEGMQS